VEGPEEGIDIVKKLIASGVLVAALVAPAAATADGPTATDTKNAAKECKALRKAAGNANFTAMFGGKRNAFGKCVSQRAKQNHKRGEAAQKNAAKECKAERDADPAAFKQKYKNLGKCVSERARQKQQEAEQQARHQDTSEKNAAKKCKAERKNDPAGFAQRYGSRRNAFGKCVSRNANGSAGQYVEQS
jgi:hypothetical protein